MKLRLAAMVQAVCRIRIRRHDGDKIHIFYSDDINQELMKGLYDYFIKSSDKGTLISGMPIYVKNARNDRLIERTIALCTYDKALFSAIKYRLPYTLKIGLKDLLSIIPMKERRARAYEPLVKELLKEYGITLTVS